MRGSAWAAIKPILKVLQEHFPSSVHQALVVKPDNFWQKQRTTIGAHKYKFEVKFFVLLSGIVEMKIHNNIGNFFICAT